MYTREILKKGTVAVFLVILVMLLPSKVYADVIKSDITTVFNKSLMNFSSQEPLTENGTIYVPIKDICEKIGATINWSEKDSRVEIKYNGKTIIFKAGSATININGSTSSVPRTKLINGRTMVALSILSQHFGINYQYSIETKILLLKNTGDFPTKFELQNILDTKKNSSVKYSEEDIYWLSRIVQAEAGGESYDAKVAVANVILNRKNSEEFPSTIKGVIFDTKYGVQFTPIANGAINNTPSDDSIRASKDALEGKVVAKGALYFLNPKSAKTMWTARNREFAYAIENHNFYY